MRIVILTQYFLPEMGAPQSRLSELAAGLKALGWEVSVITAMPNYPTGKIFDGYRNLFKRTEIVNGITTRRYWLYASNSLRTMPRIISMLSFSGSVLFSLFIIRRENPAFLMVESPPLPLAFSGWILSRLSGSKFIMNVSDLWPLSARELGVLKDGTIYRALEGIERFLYRKAFLCTGQSQEIVDHIRQHTDQVHLFRNGVDTARFAAGAYSPEKRTHLVYAGLLGVAQGVLAICQNINFQELGSEFHIYGSGAEQKAIEQYLTLHPERGIYYEGLVSRDRMPSTLCSYGGALIPLIKNIYGAVPSKIYEAIAAGLPVIFSGEGEGAAIIRLHKSGWINPPGNWNALSQNILAFVNMDEETFQRKRAANRSVASQYYDRLRQVNELNKAILKIS